MPKLAVLDHLEEFKEEPQDAAEPTSGLVGMADAALPGADDEELLKANAVGEAFISSAGRYGTKSRTRRRSATIS